MPTRDEIQQEAIDAIFRERDAGRKSTLLQMPTQTGKTRTAVKYSSKVIHEFNGRILVLSDRGELLNQWAAEYRRFDIPYQTEKGELTAYERMNPYIGPQVKVCLGSKDSFQKARLSRWPKDFFTDLILDECDLATAKSWKNIQRHFSSAFRLGLTATIDRLDGVKLSTIFESTAYVYRIEDAIANGHRVPFRVVACDVEIDIGDLRPIRGGNLPQAELVCRIGPKLEEIANVVKKHFDRLGIGKAVAFLPGGHECWTAYSFADILTQIGVPSEGVSGNNKSRESIIRRFLSDDFRVLCNTGLVARGFNDPAIDAVIHLNPTMSRALYDQRSGRCGATRDGKEHGYLLHPCWKTDLELVGPTDIFAEHYPPKVRQLAAKLAKTANGAVDPQQLLKKAKEIVEQDEERERQKLRYKAQQRDVRHKYRDYDPIRVASPWLKEASDDVSYGVSQQLRRELSELGIHDHTGLNDSIASDLVQFWNDRYTAGMSTQKQVGTLVRSGWKEDRVMEMTNREAQEVIKKFYAKKPSYR